MSDGGKLGAIDGTIAALTSDLAPVRRLWPPPVRAAVWIGALVLVGSALAVFADRAAVAHRLMAVPDMWLAVLGSATAAILGAIAAFELSVPGRSSWWALLPVPSLVLWVASSGMGCLRTWFIPATHAASMVESRDCLVFIVGVSLPLSLLMVVMLRRAFPLRPNLTAAVGGLAIAAGAATLLNFFHPFDASASDLAVHGLAVALVVVLNLLFARRALR